MILNKPANELRSRRMRDFFLFKNNPPLLREGLFFRLKNDDYKMVTESTP
jgi:hypothetical protein